MASWGKHIVSGVKLVIQCFLSIVLASVFIFDAAADTSTDTDTNANRDACTDTDTDLDTVTHFES